MVLWFCGLSGAGKTTIANGLKQELEKRGKQVRVLDGDVVRTTLHRHLGFTPEDIRENNRLISQLCLSEIGQHDFVLVPIISPFQDSRAEARKCLAERFFEVYINAPLTTCMQRDAKGLYQQARDGKMTGLIGSPGGLPFEPPLQPDVEIRTESLPVAASVQKLMRFLTDKELL